jgi:hypothetical protein
MLRRGIRGRVGVRVDMVLAEAMAGAVLMMVVEGHMIQGGQVGELVGVVMFRQIKGEGDCRVVRGIIGDEVGS